MLRLRAKGGRDHSPWGRSGDDLMRAMPSRWFDRARSTLFFLRGGRGRGDKGGRSGRRRSAPRASICVASSCRLLSEEDSEQLNERVELIDQPRCHAAGGVSDVSVAVLSDKWRNEELPAIVRLAGCRRSWRRGSSPACQSGEAAAKTGSRRAGKARLNRRQPCSQMF